MVGIVILNYNNWQATYECLNSILENTTGVEYKVYLVDNASTNTMPGDIKTLIKNNKIEFILNNKNLGYNAGNNVGVSKALKDNCEYIIISNNDVIYLKDSVLNMVNFLENNTNENIGIVTPRELTIDKQIRIPTAFYTPSIDRIIYNQTGFRHIFPQKARSFYKDFSNNSEPFEVFAAGGGIFMMTKECAQKVTPFDEHTFLYSEEWILGTVMKKFGYKTIVLPTVQVIHNHGTTMETVPAFSQMHLVCSEIYFCRKYLNANKFKILILYFARTLAFIFKSFKNSNYRKFLFKYFKNTFKEFNYKYGENYEH